ncbi:hypothetical protein GCM10022254_26080 [Actinomadura meridiana]|uniref:Serine/arginine repetitive matrix protein 2 n=1 Tax=Actinomadura meridiana TaxID=559626 RepID=A0ABP8BZ37_9ACTN
MGPGQAGSSWTAPPPIRPSARWYALPAVLVVVAVAGLLALVAALWDDAQAADGPSAAGSPETGVTIQLSRAHGYFLYVRTGGLSPFACSVKVGERSGPIRLTRQNSWSASEHPEYRYTASFEAPVSGRALLTCRGTEGPILVTPDDTVHGYIGLAVMVALGLGGVAVIAFVVIIVRRGGAKRGAAHLSGPYGR